MMLPATVRERYHRKVIRVRAQDSPNVRRALRQIALGLEPDGASEIPGILSWKKYLAREKTWDKMRKCIGLEARFWEGGDVLLFPVEWLDRCEQLADQRPFAKSTRNCLGVDAAEGGDNTSWTIANDWGCPFMRSKKTRDTSDIPGETIAIMREWNVRPEDCCFDRGGGGKQHADQLRRRGYHVRTIAFGSPATMERKRGMVTFGERIESDEDKYVYKNRRAEMYFEFSLMAQDFAIPGDILNRPRSDGGPSLRDQLRKFPRLIDDNGRYWLPSKGVVTDDMAKQEIKTLVQIIGCSPDESDSLVLAYHALKHPPRRSQAGAA